MGFEERTLSGGIVYVVAPSLANAVAVANRCIDMEWDALPEEQRKRMEGRPVVLNAKFFAPWVIDWQALRPHTDDTDAPLKLATVEDGDE